MKNYLNTQENIYENVGDAGAGSSAGVGAGAGGAAQWWWRACRRRALASQTLEFNERPGRGRGGCGGGAGAGTVPRGVRLSSSCGTIDLPIELPPCSVLLLQRWAPRPAPPPPAQPSCSHHLLPESQRALPPRPRPRPPDTCPQDAEGLRSEEQLECRSPTPEPLEVPDSLEPSAEWSDDSQEY